MRSQMLSGKDLDAQVTIAKRRYVQLFIKNADMFNYLSGEEVHAYDREGLYGADEVGYTVVLVSCHDVAPGPEPGVYEIVGWKSLV